MLPGLSIDIFLIQGLLGTYRTFLGTPLIPNEAPKVVAWPNPPSLIRVGVNHVTNFRNPLIRYLDFSKTGPPGASDLRLGCSWA